MWDKFNQGLGQTLNKKNWIFQETHDPFPRKLEPSLPLVAKNIGFFSTSFVPRPAENNTYLKTRPVFLKYYWNTLQGNQLHKS